MKGGKGGHGRQRTPQRGGDKAKPVTGVVKKGSPKKDWGALPNDDDNTSPPPPAEPPRRGKPRG